MGRKQAERASASERERAHAPPLSYPLNNSYLLLLNPYFHHLTTRIKPTFLPSKTIAKVIGINNYSYRYQ
jgi:hypothetical protein